MSEGTFTAGPWRINRAIGGHYRDGKLLSWHITADPSGSVDPICERTFGTDRSDAEDSANARLIAAAPDGYAIIRAEYDAHRGFETLPIGYPADRARAIVAYIRAVEGGAS